MAKRNLDDTDRRLISLLRANARMPTAALGRHLENAVRTGTWCSYRPEAPVAWELDQGRSS